MVFWVFVNSDRGALISFRNSAPFYFRASQLRPLILSNLFICIYLKQFEQAKRILSGIYPAELQLWNTGELITNELGVVLPTFQMSRDSCVFALRLLLKTYEDWLKLIKTDLSAPNRAIWLRLRCVIWIANRKSLAICDLWFGALRNWLIYPVKTD